MCSWDNDEGLESFKQTLSDANPDRLYIWESTARGFNQWYDMWGEARKDPAHCKCIFLGWWSKDSQRIERDSVPETRKRVGRPHETHARTGIAKCPTAADAAISARYLVYLFM